MSSPGNPLPRILVLGAGLGGTIAAYEIRDASKGRAEVTVVSDSEDYWFVPSNPWVAVRWREPDAIRVSLPPVMAKKGIDFTSVGATREWVPNAKHWIAARHRIEDVVVHWDGEYPQKAMTREVTAP